MITTTGSVPPEYTIGSINFGPERRDDVRNNPRTGVAYTAHEMYPVFTADPFKKYVVGFLFDEWDYNVALIEKLRPAWQFGLLNGPGGHIETGETAEHAMMREFAEETGLVVTNWRHFAALGGNGFLVHFFESRGALDLLESRTDERIVTIPVSGLQNPNIQIIPNLRWLIPLSLDRNVIAEIKQNEKNANLD